MAEEISMDLNYVCLILPFPHFAPKKTGLSPLLSFVTWMVGVARLGPCAQQGALSFWPGWRLGGGVGFAMLFIWVAVARQDGGPLLVLRGHAVDLGMGAGRTIVH